MPLRVLRSGRRAGRLKRRAGARCVGPFRKKEIEMNALFDCPRRVLRIGHGLLALSLIHI
ncbi:hypothetical protein FA362_31275 [Pseudomonas aeruginosa]|nr:hypothetical protein [Pseudomonas aeruginosa]